MSIPSRAKASERICAASRSSLPRNIGSFCTIVTCEPNRQKACASSHPSGPPPRTRRREGHPFRSKNILVGQIGGLGEPSNRRSRGSRTTGDQCTLEVQPFALNYNRLGSVETCLPEIYIDTHRTQFLCGESAADSCTHTLHALHHR